MTIQMNGLHGIGIHDTRKVIYKKMNIIIITKLKKVLQYVNFLFSFSRHENLISKSLKDNAYICIYIYTHTNDHDWT